MASQALLKAVTSARFTQTRLMLQMGADVNIKDVEGQTPIIRALCLPRVKVRTRLLLLLLRAGALVSQCDNQKRNALMWACMVSSVEDVSLLLHHADVDLDVNARNSDGQTGLWIAVEGDKVEVVQKLIQVLSKHELDFEVEDHAGVTPAQLAAKLGHLDCLHAMVKHLNCADKSVCTLITMNKVNTILKSVGTTNGPAEHVSNTPTHPQEGFKPVKGPPIIQVISSLGHKIVSHSPRPGVDSPRTAYPVLFPTVSKDQPMSSPSTRRLSRSAIPDWLRGTTPEQQHDHNEKTSLPRLKDAALAGEDGGSFVKDRCQSSFLRDQRSSSSVSGSRSELPHGGPEVPVFFPVPGRARSVASVQGSLPGLLEIHAQQISESFRKTAIWKTPPPPKPVEPEPEITWSKLKGVAAMTRLRKTGNMTGITAAAAALAGGHWEGGPAAAESNEPAQGLAKLFLRKRRVSAVTKPHSVSEDDGASVSESNEPAQGLAKLFLRKRRVSSVNKPQSGSGDDGASTPPVHGPTLRKAGNLKGFAAAAADVEVAAGHSESDTSAPGVAADEPAQGLAKLLLPKRWVSAGTQQQSG